MAVLVKKLHALTQGGTQEDFELATTKDETGNTENFLVGSVDGETVYAGLDTDLTASSLRVKKSGTTYAVKKTGFVAGSQDYTTAGTYTFTAPFTHSYTVEVAGGGGGGGGGVYNKNMFGQKTGQASGGNGGRGALVTTTLNLIKGATYSVVVGRGGGGGGVKEVYVTGTGQGGTGGTGGTSSFDSTSARGGGGGTGGYMDNTKDDWVKRNGSAGTSYGNGGTGGTGGSSMGNGGAGGTGWVKIKWE